MKAKIAVLAILLSLAAPSFAEPAKVDFRLPTQNVDGTPIPATGPLALTFVRVEWGTCAAGSTPTAPLFGTQTGSVEVPNPGTTAVIDVTRGTSVCVRAKARNESGAESAYSKVVHINVPLLAPKSPMVIQTINF